MLQMISVGFFFPKPRLCGTQGMGNWTPGKAPQHLGLHLSRWNFFPPQHKPREVELILVGFSWGKKIYSFVEKTLLVYLPSFVKDHVFSWKAGKKTKLQKCWKEITAGCDRFVWRVWLFNALYGLRFQISITNPR